MSGMDISDTGIIGMCITVIPVMCVMYIYYIYRAGFCLPELFGGVLPADFLPPYSVDRVPVSTMRKTVISRIVRIIVIIYIIYSQIYLYILYILFVIL